MDNTGSALIITAEQLLARYGTMFHTELQIDAFIVNRGGHGHPYGMFLQTMREISARVEGSALFEENVARLEIQERAACRAARRNAWTARARDKRGLAAVEARSLRRQLASLLQEQGERERELSRFVQHATALLQALGPLGPQRRKELDEEYWVHRLRYKLATDILVEGRPSFALLELIPCLPIQAREKLQLEFKPENWGKVTSWFFQLQTGTLDAEHPERAQISD